MHATEVARELGIGTIIVPPHPGILCAEGLLNSELALDFVQTLLVPLDAANLAVMKSALQDLKARAHSWFEKEGARADGRQEEVVADLRYLGQNYELTLPLGETLLDATALEGLASSFHKAHEQNYGFANPCETIQLVNLKIKARVLPHASPLPKLEQREPAQPVAVREVIFVKGASEPTPVFRRTELAAEQVIAGPAIIEQMDSTTIIHPGDRCRIDALGNLIIDIKSGDLA